MLSASQDTTPAMWFASCIASRVAAQRARRRDERGGAPGDGRKGAGIGNNSDGVIAVGGEKREDCLRYASKNSAHPNVGAVVDIVVLNEGATARAARCPVDEEAGGTVDPPAD